MRVGIIGNYGHNNNGDEAILTGILHQLTEHVGVRQEDIVIFSNQPSNTTERYQMTSVPLLYKEGSILKSGIKTVKESYKVMKGLDLLIVGGGGLLMDMYKRDAPLYSVLGMTGKRAGCQVVVYGVGAGPIKTSTGRFFIKKLVNLAESVSVRDGDSKALLEKIGANKEVHVIGDPAFSVPAEQTHKPTQVIKKVGVTAVPYFSQQYWPTPDVDKYHTYVKGMAAQLDRLITEKNVEITFYSTKFPEDVQVTKDILAEMKNEGSTTIIEDNLHPKDIVRISAEQDLIIGTRLHSLILSVVAETPVIGVGYHHKVLDFMQLMEMDMYGVPIENVTTETTTIVDAFKDMEQNWTNVQKRFVSVSTQLKAEAFKGTEQFKLN
ncbi:polysaccharide pyruvyl transferase family protein [Alkalihalophilus lindianensis]|uniref:Polysaccharide pyruvyl transferase family protein n=1 Tax=Alkalihalophilus lindianensis TaxID=1630542 RepID=A0ABU3X8W7_9BACI|nr:polysaccharide pyruvyl transferase family protein [Alkalihalophilus lindianensis]MDV2684326.1 polysaccharide pyruvyl transferase family protein [Alkalihalophilus lindianensis]